jgi:hypothetical protein
MTTISCFYIHYNREPINFTFIRFQKYIKIVLNDKAIILELSRFAANKSLFQIYILSLLLTEDTNSISVYHTNTESNENIYGVSTMWYWKYLHLVNDYRFVELEKQATRNPLNMLEPKRETSEKKIRKFDRHASRYFSKYIQSPIYVMSEYYTMETSDDAELCERYNSYSLKTTLLLCVNRRMGYDIYSQMRKILN